MIGKIKTVRIDKGYLFIASGGEGDQQGKDIFGHRSACADFNDLNPGDTVTFELEPQEFPSSKGPRATGIVRLTA
jgi:cold shock CspA family protein